MPEPSLFGVGKAQWEMINSFANWLSAIGTLAAVVVSLYLASRSTNKARLSVGIRIFIGPGSEAPYPEYVVFKIVNHGERPLRITQIGWKWGLWKKHYAVQLYEESLSARLPVDLAHAQEAQWFFPTTLRDGMEPWATYFGRTAMMPHYRIAIRTLRAQAFSSLGKAFVAKPESNLLDTLYKACAALPAETSTAGPRRPLSG